MRLASSSNTAMNSRPMILRFCSGSVTPASAAKKRASASTTCRSALKAPAKSASTPARSPCRRRPLSTKMQVSRSPMALSSSLAATDESTPPDRPRMTRPRSPTCLRMWTSASSAKLAIVQIGDSLQTRKRKFDEQLAAARRVRHLGVELDAVDAPLLVGDGGVGRVRRLADEREARAAATRRDRRATSTPPAPRRRACRGTGRCARRRR